MNPQFQHANSLMTITKRMKMNSHERNPGRTGTINKSRHSSRNLHWLWKRAIKSHW